MEIRIPELALVVLVGPSSSGKSTFAKKYFTPYEIVSSDNCRAIVSNDPTNQAATEDAFELLYYTIEKRLKNGLLTVVDATNVQEFARQKLIDLAKAYHVIPVAFVFKLNEAVCLARNALRNDRKVPTHAIKKQVNQLRRSFRHLKKEGFRPLHVFQKESEVNKVEQIIREKMHFDKKEVTGPFDIIGDIHGCYDELILLLKQLGYQVNYNAEEAKHFGIQVSHPEGRQIIFVGDLEDRGPNSPGVLKLVMSMINDRQAFCVQGNHDFKLFKKLTGKKVNISHGLQETLDQLEQEDPSFINQLIPFLGGLVPHYIFDEGKLVVAHAGLRESMHGRVSGKVRNNCLFGETTGETDEFGYPIRLNWAADYNGKALVAYGHTPVPSAKWQNNTVNLDTGCVFGGKLTALRYPEMEIISVKAKKTYTESKKFEQDLQNEIQGKQQSAHLLNLEDVLGNQVLSTRLISRIFIKESQSTTALETMSRFAMDPKWLIYLPPTMSPSEVSPLPDFLEHPMEAFQYYAEAGISQVICEEKHMGSRALLVVCQDEKAAQLRFGVLDGKSGVCYTRTGRPFFKNEDNEKGLINKVQQALTGANFWEKHETDWVCLDAELMPWSLKADELIRQQFAPVGSAALPALDLSTAWLTKAVESGLELGDLLERTKKRKTSIEQYIAAYQPYCWEVQSIEDYQLAPFHILATQQQVHHDKTHLWHLEQIEAFTQFDVNLFHKTRYITLNPNDEQACQMATDWWLSLTAEKREGMVVKPIDFLPKDQPGKIQPAIKCRGKEYLRIIYGPEYLSPLNLSALKKRSLSKKRAMAMKEFALGIEALERFVRKEDLRKVHECVFAILALESESVDPRL